MITKSIGLPWVICLNHSILIGHVGRRTEPKKIKYNTVDDA
jgi:hypothetical protein